ncbi:MAG: hypothetical protein JWN95_1105 [Frankiales bacterium]|nr:hypothetical protein [Frankiales bacterium]
MQSRFAAFAVGDSAYLLRTWHRSTRPESIELDPQLRWTHLEIVEAVGGGPFDTNGIVEFRAHYRQDRTQSVLHERSTFVREDGQWHYLSGIST